MKPILILQNHPAEGPGTILDFLREKNMPFEMRHTYQNQPIPDISDVEAVINLGCPHPSNRYHELDYLVDVHRCVSETVRTGKPYLGICFGGQILAMVLGGAVRRNHTSEIGTCRIRLTDVGTGDPLFQGFKESFSAFEWHHDTFEIPPGASNLAESDDCTNQAFRLGEAVGLQFHLELDAVEVARLCDTYPDEIVSVGKTSDNIVGSFKTVADTSRALNYRLLDNFFAS